MRNNQQQTFAQLGEIFDDATNRMIGGVDGQNSKVILRDLSQVQSGLERLLESHPEQFEGVAGIHAQNIIDQINLEVNAIRSIGTDPFAPKYINDVQRDLIDIVQGDTQLQALASHNGHQGFSPVPDLLVAPAQFRGNAEQTDFMRNFAATSQDFADRAVALIDQNGSPEAVQQLIGEVQAFSTAANAFTTAQGGLYSARFDNEFAENGVNGTASRALIDGLQSGNVDKVHAAAEVLAANAADVAGNMLGIGDPVVSTGNGIPDHVESFAQAGTIFNDATAKLVGGIYDGNRQSIHDDLTATRQGILDIVAQQPDQFTGRAGADANRIVELLGRELLIVDNPDSSPNAVSKLHDLHSKVVNIVQHDAVLATAANEGGAAGFMSLPTAAQGHDQGGGGSGAGPREGGHASGATNAMPEQADPLAHIFPVHTDYHHG